MEPVSAPESQKKAAPGNGASPKPKKLADPSTLTQDAGKKQHGKGKVGSLENPEVYDNVPGHVIPILEREFDDFDTEAASFLRGEQTEEQFIGFRLKQGVYGQRQPDVQMCRIKLPFGGVNPEQMETFADVVEQFAPLNKGHITTRQNIQIHHIPLADMAELIRQISSAGLSSREGCGNTIRNVTGDPWAGVADDEPFDITPYAAAYTRYFVRHPTTQLMPRKVKTAFTASDADRAITGIHDVGFIPKVREVDGKEVKGVEIRIGGGTSIQPRIAPTLNEFVELDNGDYLKWTEAALRIFDRQEWLRENRMRARIKVLVDKIGMDAFRELVDEELEGDWVNERDFSIDHLLYVHDEEADAPAVPESYGSPNGDKSEFDAWVDANVQPQRQEGFVTATVKVIRGDLTPEQFRGLAAIMRDLTGGFARTTVQQNLVLRWVRPESLYDIWVRLKDLDLGRLRRVQRHRRRQLPRHRQLQVGHHGLHGAEPGAVEAARGDGDHRSAHQADPHQDERLPQRLLAAPHRHHRVLRRLDQGRRAHDPGLHPSHRRQLRGRRRRLRPPAEGEAPRQAGAGRCRALDPPLRGEPQRR